MNAAQNTATILKPDQLAAMAYQINETALSKAINTVNKDLKLAAQRGEKEAISLMDTVHIAEIMCEKLKAVGYTCTTGLTNPCLIVVRW